jgi:thiamine pyrophosphokinase
VRAVIFANGNIENQDHVAAILRSEDYLIAADGGAEHCKNLNLKPDVVIGDMDSISRGVEKGLHESGTKFISYPEDKDKTDLELALSYTQKIGADEILLFGILGGRLDMTVANLLLLAKDEWSDVSISVVEGGDTAYLINNTVPVSLVGKIGDKVSLIPLSGRVEGVSTSGLRWKLNDDILYFGDTRGVSNELSASTGDITVRSGKLLIVHRKSFIGYDED